jgi:formylmethanofuran dehydrogenase subunit E
MDMRITVTVKPQKPYTCIIDGLQCATVATMGKGNMTLRKGRRDIRVAVRKGKEHYCYRITQKALHLCTGADPLPTAALKILRTPARALWNRC